MYSYTTKKKNVSWIVKKKMMPPPVRLHDGDVRESSASERITIEIRQKSRFMRVEGIEPPIPDWQSGIVATTSYRLVCAYTG